MKFLSTRNKDLKISAREAIVKGISEDGGLFVPESFPRFDIFENIELKYTDLAHKILSLYLTDFDEGDLKELIEKSYATFPEFVANVEYNSNEYLELYHGKTSAFKDFALCLLPNLLAYAKKSLGIEDKTLILTATSGDTGKAALEGFYNKENIDILVVYPTDGVSAVQKLQMDTTDSLNSKVIAIEGNFDDAQSSVKEIFNNPEIKKSLSDKNVYLSSANSINIGRLLPQIVYYFYAYADLYKNNKIQKDEKISFCVPTGNFGDILAGFYAKEMGLPVDKLIIASNSNNVLTDFFSTGVYNANRELEKTMSPSMDILISSNLERLLFHKSSDEVVVEKMNDLKTKGEFNSDIKFDEFLCGFANEEETSKTILKVYEEDKYLIDPHTAVAKFVADKCGVSNTVILSTASPYKFSSSVLSSLGEKLSEDEFDNIELLNEKTGVEIPKEIAKLRNKKLIHDTKIDKKDISKEVLNFSDRGTRISVPATSANLGPGFDALGLAVNLYNICEYKKTDEVEEYNKNIKENLIYKSYDYTFNYYGEKSVPIKIESKTDIPMSRGLGSSSTCVVMGILAAFHEIHKEIDRREILKIATEIEGHPDNVSPAIFGGFTSTVFEDNKIYLEEFKASDKIKFLALIPDSPLLTESARKVLPENYSRKDAVFNISRTSILPLALISGNYENLKIAFQDKIHESYRFKLIPEMDKIQAAIKESDAISHYLSGAGSTIMLVLKSDDFKTKEFLGEKLSKLDGDYKLIDLEIDYKGALII
ncbi:threonine synthase [Peptoniphilus sp. MSJ-1]|uniref:Homoserine kinase n=1 Tax=Peptoniphilus ovalis TaxID=2841503 RepID=A0ABS6FGU7_9FIRM|nr:threonine synthase [Peptoniphilus ovalis]MBU5669199.1 threonine synthase [Peptoniphilus ovalis]